MKFYFPVDSEGNILKLLTPEHRIFDDDGMCLSDKMNEMEKTLNIMIENIDYMNAALDSLEPPRSELDIALDNVILREDSNANICLLSDNNGVVTSEYGYDYKILAGLLYDGNYSEYIKDGDWIELNTPDGGTYKMYANIDTYYGEGEEGKEIGHHIDFISEELIYGCVGNNDSYNYSSTDINSWRMNYDTTYNSYGSNNGVATETSPFLANSTEHRGAQGGIIDKLNSYYSTNISESLKAHIVKKYHKVPTRYKSGTGLTDDNGSKWAEMPYLWIPYEWEIWGSRQYATNGSESHMKQYHSFSSNSEFRKKYDKRYSTSSTVYWLAASAHSGYDNDFCGVNASGAATVYLANYYRVGVPLCFRFGAEFYTNKPIIREDANANICLLSDNNGVVSSAYNYTYEFLADKLYSGEYSDYIKDGDWIELTTADGATYTMYANVDTYYGEGPENAKCIGHHIDFISKELIYGSTSKENGSSIYSASDINSWRMNYDTTYNTTGSNNGTSTESSPFLANSTQHRGSEGGIIDKLDAYYNDNISEALKAHIIKKYHKVPTRYSTSSITSDNGSKWTNMPYLWIPYYKEVTGTDRGNYESHMVQYHSFANITDFDLKRDDKDISTSGNWWMATANVGNNKDFYYMSTTADPSSSYYASYWNNGAPLCFRFAGKPSSDEPIIRSDSEANICLLTDDNGVITSDYNYTYEFLADVLDSGNYSDYIKDGDYIKLKTKNGDDFIMYANIDTYYGEGEEGKEIGHHIDFISKDLIPGCVGNGGSQNYSSTNINSWRMNHDRTYNDDGSNNGTATEASPFLANSTEHRGVSSGGIIDTLNIYYNNLPDTLKSYVVKKYHKVPTRYTSGSKLTSDNGSKWAEMPYLWIPYEKEIFGTNTNATATYESHMVQYHSFSSISNFGIKYDTKYNTAKPIWWWTASAYGSSYSAFIDVTHAGGVGADLAMQYYIGVPLCFRFMKNKPFDPFEGFIKTGTTNVCLLSDDNGVVTSRYGFTYDTLANILDSGEYTGYIKDGDWIELKTPDGGIYTMYANIDTYYGVGEEGKEIGHHIDFISKELIYGSYAGNNGTEFISTSINSWRMNYDNTYNTGYGSNNGVSTETSPFLANSTEHRGSSTGGIIDKLNTYYHSNISDGLKAHIVKKYHNIPTRYSTSSLTDDNGSKWAELPYLWIPYYTEIWGTDYSKTYKPTATYESDMKQYHSFANITDFKKKPDNLYSTSKNVYWWTASACTGGNTDFCDVSSTGAAVSNTANYFKCGAPLCFRFMKEKPFDILDTVKYTGSTNVCLLKDNNGEVTSDYGFTYDKLAGILYSGDYAGYIKNGDWIELTTNDGATYNMYANVDTYYGEGPENAENAIGHHIDFISKELIYGSTSKENGSSIYSASDINSWRMNKDTKYSTTYGNNNGVSTESSPFLANCIEHRGSEGGIIDKLNAYYNDNINDVLKKYIIKKYHKVPIRYKKNSKQTDDNGSKWAYLPYLWIPYHRETVSSTTNTYETHMKQYHSFSSISSFKNKCDNKNPSTNGIWWTASASPSSVTSYDYRFRAFNANAAEINGYAYMHNYGAPLCFRFAGKPYSDEPIIRSNPEANICLLTDDNGVITSDYNYTYEFLADVLDSGNYSEYIKDGDYIKLRTKNGDDFIMYANIDTYYGTGEEGKEIGHHIDFISKDLIPGSTSRDGVSYIYSATNINTWRMNYDTRCNYSGSYTGHNNGISSETSPFLANSTKRRGTNGGIIDKLDAYYSNLPDTLKRYVVKKYHKVPTRYSSTSNTLTKDNGNKWAEMPYLWIPYYKEVWGDTTNTNYCMPTTTYEADMVQYHSFSSISDFRVKIDSDANSSAGVWWLASANETYYFSFCTVDDAGKATYNAAYSWETGVPLCFRFMKDKPYDPYEGVVYTGTTNVCLLTDDNGTVTSNYGFTYDKLSGILQSGDYKGYIKDGDWIELKTADGATYNMYANVDTYYGEGEEGKEIGHHIDFISKELIYGCVGSGGSYTYSETDINSWRMNKHAYYSTAGNNNGVSTEESPFLANSTEHRGSSGGILDKFKTYYDDNINDELKSHIIKKYHNIPIRYSTSGALTNDNGSKWAELPYLWIPYDMEIFGSNKYSTPNFEAHMVQYHSFANISNFKIKYDNKYSTSSAVTWWSASANSTSYESFCTVSGTGLPGASYASGYRNGTPLCFRFQ